MGSVGPIFVDLAIYQQIPQRHFDNNLWPQHVDSSTFWSLHVLDNNNIWTFGLVKIRKRWMVGNSKLAFVLCISSFVHCYCSNCFGNCFKILSSETNMEYETSIES